MAKLMITTTRMYLCYGRTGVAFCFDDAEDDEDVAGEDDEDVDGEADARTAVAFCFCKVSGGK